jgi:hypothetical protein
MPVERLSWRCRYTDGGTDQAAPCWVAAGHGPRLAIDRIGGCLARTVDEAQRCAEETLANGGEPETRDGGSPVTTGPGQE